MKLKFKTDLFSVNRSNTFCKFQNNFNKLIYIYYPYFNFEACYLGH